MFSLNRVDIIGYQTQPVALRKVPSGTSVCDLNLVVPYSFQSQKGDLLSLKSFHTVTLWGPMADVAGQFVRPGSQVFISGRLQTDSWEDTETKEKRNKTKIVALDFILLDPKNGQMEAPEGSPLLASCVNRAQVVGNVTRDPELRTTTSGQQVVSLGVATNERWKEKATGETKERSEFHNIVIWGELAKQVSSSVRKGQRIYASGRVQTRSFETKDGKKRYTTEITADQVSILGVKNAETVTSTATKQQPSTLSNVEGFPAAESPEPASVAAVTMPEIKYESEIKPEDLPF